MTAGTSIPAAFFDEARIREIVQGELSAIREDLANNRSQVLALAHVLIQHLEGGLKARDALLQRDDARDQRTDEVAEAAVAAWRGVLEDVLDRLGDGTVRRNVQADEVLGGAVVGHEDSPSFVSGDTRSVGARATPGQNPDSPGVANHAVGGDL